MKYFRTIFILGLLSLLFVGNIGVNVFKHICKEDGVTVSYLVDRGEECCADESNEKNVPSCCHSNEEEEQDDDCCSHEVLYFKMHVDAEQHFLPNFSFCAEAELPVEIARGVSPEYAEQEVAQGYITPPPPNGRDILLLKQVWLI